MIFKKLFINLLLISIIQLPLINPIAANTDTVCFMYVSLRGDNAIAVYKLNNRNGEPKFIYSHEVNGGPASIAIHPTKKYLFVAQRSINSISSFSIDTTTGYLTLVNTINAVDNPVYVATDKTGNYLLTAYYAGNKAATYSINPNGSINAAPIKTIDTGTGTNPHAILTNATNEFLYITNMSGNKILQYAFDDNTGNFTPLTPAEVNPSLNTGPRHFIFHGSKRILYTANELGNSVGVYLSNPINGTLSELQTISALPATFIGTNKSADIHITPDNQFLYVSNRGHESIAAFSINNNDGSLSSIGYFNTVASPREFEISPTGKYLYAAGETNGNLTYYGITNSGTLDSITTISTGKTPSWITIVSYTQAPANNYKLEEKTGLRLRCFPNPAQNNANIEYFIYKPSFVSLQIFDSNGALIETLKNTFENRGQYSVSWETKKTKKHGVYFCRLITDTYQKTIKLIISG